MYYKLGLGGRALWSVTVFTTWLVVTMVAVFITLRTGIGLGDALREWCRDVGLNPIVSDLFKLLVAIFGFVMVPILTTSTIAKLNKRLKGKNDEPQR